MDNKISSCLGTTLLAVVVAIIGSLTEGWALSVVWNWFMPTIFALPMLTLWQAVGVFMVLSLFTGVNKTKKIDDKKYDSVFEALVVTLTASVVGALLQVGFAYIIFQLAF